MTLVAISGSQSCGKTTLLNKLKEKGFKTIDRKTSRSILKEWGVSLAEVNADLDLTMKFQEEVAERKFQDEVNAYKSNELVFTERTHADLFTYALITLGKHNRCSDWLDHYYHLCLKHNQQYSLVYYLKAGLFRVEADGVRGVNKHYSRLVDVTMLDFTQQMTHPSRLSIIDVADLDQRVSLIATQTLSILSTAR